VNPLKTLARVVIPAVCRKPLGVAVRKCTQFGLGRYCPCCNSHLRRFNRFGLVPRPQAICPVCGSLERHRLIYLYMAQRTDLFDGHPKKMLHIAPEAQLSHLFKKAQGIDYLSADLFVTSAMVKMDITDIQYPEATFDVIYCSHVLEHVADDRRAMRELFRVLKGGGWAILQVPISSGATFEDPTVTSRDERELLFGQHDHVRRYGVDYKERLGEAGFAVSVDGFVRELDDRTIARFGLMRGEDVYFCQKLTATDPG
jgi:SAM-dependent methyltransferase